MRRNASRTASAHTRSASGAATASLPASTHGDGCGGGRTPRQNQTHEPEEQERERGAPRRAPARRSRAGPRRRPLARGARSRAPHARVPAHLRLLSEPVARVHHARSARRRSRTARSGSAARAAAAARRAAAAARRRPPGGAGRREREQPEAREEPGAAPRPARRGEPPADPRPTQAAIASGAPSARASAVTSLARHRHVDEEAVRGEVVVRSRAPRRNAGRLRSALSRAAALRLHVRGAQVELREVVVGRAEHDGIDAGPVRRGEVRGPRALEVALEEEDVPDVDRELGRALVRARRPPRGTRRSAAVEVAAPLGEPAERGRAPRRAPRRPRRPRAPRRPASDTAPCSTAWTTPASVPLQAVSRAARRPPTARRAARRARRSRSRSARDEVEPRRRARARRARRSGPSPNAIGHREEDEARNAAWTRAVPRTSGRWWKSWTTSGSRRSEQEDDRGRGARDTTAASAAPSEDRPRRRGAVCGSRARPRGVARARRAPARACRVLGERARASARCASGRSGASVDGELRVGDRRRRVQARCERAGGGASLGHGERGEVLNPELRRARRAAPPRRRRRARISVAERAAPLRPGLHELSHARRTGTMRRAPVLRLRSAADVRRLAGRRTPRPSLRAAFGGGYARVGSRASVMPGRMRRPGRGRGRSPSLHRWRGFATLGSAAGPIAARPGPAAPAVPRPPPRPRRPRRRACGGATCAARRRGRRRGGARRGGSAIRGVATRERDASTARSWAKKTPHMSRAADAIERLLGIMERLRGPRRLPVGPRADASDASGPTCSRRRTRCSRRSTRATRASTARSSATCSCRSSSRPQLRTRGGAFEFADVADAISTSSSRRHPHVFGDAR